MHRVFIILLTCIVTATLTGPANSQDLLVEHLDQRWVDGGWVNTARATYKYNTTNRPDDVVVEVWRHDQWVKTERRSYEYEDTLLSTETVEVWTDDLEWQKSERIQFARDEAGREVSRGTQEWMVDHWVDVRRESIVYTNGLATTWVSEQSIDSAWMNLSRTVTDYDALNRESRILAQSWDVDGSDWEDVSRSDWYYEGETDKLSRLVTQEWSSSAWVNRKQYLYDSSSDSEVRTTQKWLSTTNSWINEIRVSTQRNEVGSPNSVLEQEWLNNGWTNVALQTLEYDPTGVRELQQVLSYWDSATSEWQPQKKQVRTYGEPTGVEILDHGNGLPRKVELYPNPATTEIIVEISDRRVVEISIIDVLGRRVQSLSGQGYIVIQADHFPVGLYLVEVASELWVTRRAVVITHSLD